MSSSAEKGPGPRWWPAGIIAVLTLIVVGFIQFAGEAPQQARNMRCYITIGIALLALWGWLLFWSRFRWWMRLAAVLGFVVLVLAVSLSLRVSGVDGNLVPILEWRWSSGLPAADAIASPDVADAGTPGEVLAGDWPQFLGSSRDCRAHPVALETNWTPHPPLELWRVPVGEAWSGFAVLSGRAVTLEQRGEEEAAVCRSAVSGSILWEQRWPARYSTTIAGTGPRSTPSLSGEAVVVTGATGWLRCFRLEDGEPLWARNVLEENRVAVPPWGYSVSPLVVDERVMVSVGAADDRSLMAFNLTDGSLRWQGGDGALSYSSPIMARFGGVEQVVVFNARSVAGHDPGTGQVLWGAPFSARDVVVAAPLVLDQERVLFSAGYGHGSECFRIERLEDGQWRAEREWTSRRMKAKFTNLGLHDGNIFGLDDGILACISAADGELRWKDGRYGHGQMVFVGDHAIIMAEDGQVVLIEPSPDGLMERGRVKVFEDKTWNPPVLAGDLLLIRNDREAACLRLPTLGDAR